MATADEIAFSLLRHLGALHVHTARVYRAATADTDLIGD
jgi:hypothetical protein